MEIWKDIDGYCYVSLLSRQKHSIHRLVVVAFNPNWYDKCSIDHIDGDRTNNHASNLDVVTTLENNLRSHRGRKRGVSPAPNGNWRVTISTTVASKKRTISIEIHKVAPW